MMKYIFTDVDGTLVDYQNNLLDSTVRAIKKAQQNGHKIFIVTGRSKGEMYDEILDIGFDGYIGVNGAYAEIDGETIYHHGLSSEDEKAIVDWLHDRGLEFYLESNSGLYGSENFRERGKQTVIDYSAYKGNDASEFMTVEKIFPEMKFGEPLYRNDVNKISFILDSYNDYLDAKEHFSDFTVNTWGGHGEKALFGDVGLKGIRKSDGVKRILSYFSASADEAIGFGDARIDNDMLDYCGIGVAMGNAGESTKEIADYITDNVENDGMAKAFKYFGLI
ncbi:HAD family hydrolase [Aerococcus tenax]|uniref:HAD family hydrolase n=1 Tax=Aerococcus tenax TaxID=3078812 RepID=UPI001E3F4240|nr:HAD family hydrolase [Aerococcus tenax]